VVDARDGFLIEIDDLGRLRGDGRILIAVNHLRGLQGIQELLHRLRQEGHGAQCLDQLATGDLHGLLITGVRKRQPGRQQRCK
jgi:hypothetical protein